jgi:hypothetical protein
VHFPAIRWLSHMGTFVRLHGQRSARCSMRKAYCVLPALHCRCRWSRQPTIWARPHADRCHLLSCVCLWTTLPSWFGSLNFISPVVSICRSPGLESLQTDHNQSGVLTCLETLFYIGNSYVHRADGLCRVALRRAPMFLHRASQTVLGLIPG